MTVGKSIAAGIPLGAYGMTEEVAAALQRPGGRDDDKPQVAVGGTLFGNPVSMAAARATMSEVLTDEAYAHSQRLGTRLADGLAQRRRGVGAGVDDPPVLAAQRVVVQPGDAAHGHRGDGRPSTCRCAGCCASTSRTAGVWDAIVGAGPTCSVAATDEDVDAYLAAFADLIGELV